MDHFLHFIINKQSRKSEEVLKKLLIELPKYTQKYKIYPTKDIDELNKLLSLLKVTIAKDDFFVIVGGDGSLNQFISLYQKYHFENYISYIPSGSGNDFARSHQIPFDTKKAVKHLFHVKEKQVLSIIYARENSTKYYAVNSVGIGIDGFINQIVNSKNTKNNFGAFAYISALFTAFTKQSKFPVTLTVDEGEYKFKKAQLVLVANNPFFGGGINILPDADGKDSVLDILIADDVSIKDLFIIVSKLLTSRKHLSPPKLHSF
ncbi:MAG: hypothetical protein L0I93_07030, partial [Atopostipes suicloacalis]|nr:hypothetical protein [Atopostipes suicloacalis]